MNDARYALRALRKQPDFTALALVTLALGIGATTTAFAVLDTILLRPLPYANPDRLVLIREKTKTGAVQVASYPNFNDWRERARSFSGVASEQFPLALTVSVGTNVSRVVGVGISRGFFATLGVPPLVGREFTADENRVGGPRVVMVSYDFWQAQMGGRRPLGDIQVGDASVPVVGVTRPGFRFVDDADLYYPHERSPGTCRSCRNYRVVARLARGATIETARAEMTTLSRALLATYGNETSAVDADLAPLHDYIVGRYSLTFVVVLAAAALVLLVACTNLICAQLARGLSRGREIAVRAALGAPRGRLVRQLFLESAFLAAAGSALGVVIAIVFTRVVRLLGAGLVPRLEELHVDAGILTFAVSLSVATALIIGLYPALRLAGGDPGSLLHGARGSGSAVRAAVWRLLIGFEIATAMVLLVGSALLVRTMRNILTSDTGVQPHGVVIASLVAGDSVDMGKLAHLGDELSSLPGVNGVAFANHLPLDWGSTAGPVRRTTDPVDHDFPAMAGFRLVSISYFDVMRQPLLAGRLFTSMDRDGAPMVAIITPGIANALWPGRSPIGERIITNYLFDHVLTVVGVATEASSWNMPRGEQNEIYVPLAQHPARTEGQLVAFVRTTRDPAATIPAVRSRLHDVAPTMPATLSTLDERIARSAAARTHDTGIRLALGATPFQIHSAELADAASVAAAGIVVGLGLGFLATRFVAASLYGVSRVDPFAYLAAAAIVFAAAVIGAYVPSRRSSRIDPLRALRAE